MPKGPRKFHFSFEKSGLTRFGGLSLFQSFCKSLGLRHFLQLYVRWPKYHHKDYHPADLFLAHLFAIVAGIGRVENTQSLIHNGLIPPLLGLPEFPHRDTVRSFLWRFGHGELRSLVAAHDRLRQELFPRLGLRYSAIVDVDTTALITYGSQEGTAVGYVPKRRHSQPSYAPIISSEGKTGLSLPWNSEPAMCTLPLELGISSSKSWTNCLPRSLPRAHGCVSMELSTTKTSSSLSIQGGSAMALWLECTDR